LPDLFYFGSRFVVACLGWHPTPLTVFEEE
jgi:hypothetical protein